MEDRIDIIQVLEQFGTTVENQAIVVAQYYKKLLTEGLPEPLAAELTKSFANIFWSRSLSQSKYDTGNE